MITYLFPGQGSQVKGMGNGLFDRFKELTEQADTVLGYSIRELCIMDPRKELNRTEFTQPALYVVNALSYLKKIEDSGKKPDYVAGHSLGEYNALLAAECFDFESGLKLVKKRGELMSQATGGGMAAILNATKEKIEYILNDNDLSGIDLANFNTPDQTVISGLKNEIIKAEKYFLKEDIQFIVLNTSGAFHSRYMQSARDAFAEYLMEFEFSNLKIPVLSNVTAQPYKENEIAANLSNQICSSVRWYECIHYLMESGEMEFEEVGYGTVLTKMVRKIREQASNVLEKEKQVPEIKVSNEIRSNQERNNEQELQSTKIDSDEQQQSISDKTAIGTIGKKALTADEKVSAWNEKYPVGTRVKSIIIKEATLETRSKAITLFGHRAAVYMNNYNGYFDLDEVEVVQ